MRRRQVGLLGVSAAARSGACRASIAVTDLLPGLLIVIAVAGSWFGLVAPTLQTTTLVVAARQDVVQEIESMRRRLESVGDLEPKHRQAVVDDLAESMRRIRESWARARISRALRPEIEMRPSGPVLTFVEIGDSPQERDP